MNGLQQRVQSKGDLYTRRDPRLVSTNPIDVMRRLRQEVSVNFLNIHLAVNNKVSDNGALQILDNRFTEIQSDLNEIEAMVMSQLALQDELKLEYQKATATGKIIPVRAQTQVLTNKPSIDERSTFRKKATLNSLEALSQEDRNIDIVGVI